MIFFETPVREERPTSFRSLVFRISMVVLLIFSVNGVIAQEKVITAGIQFKPIFSSKFFNTGPENVTDQGVQFSITPESGFCLGMVIRRGITNTISFESGINYVKRNFAIEVNDPDSAVKSNSDFGMVGYEIPLQGLVFIQLSDEIFMDVALGLSLDFYPSDLKTSSGYVAHYSARHSWFSPAILANIGWEYRTEKSGYFYLGASYHRPFNITYTSYVQYQNRDLSPSYTSYPEAKMDLLGNYLTVDLRYFFHSDPEKRKKKTKK